MHHGGGRIFFAPIYPIWFWGILATVVVGLLIIGGILLSRRRRREKSQLGELSDKQRSTLGDFEAQVLAMLFQHGGQLNQVQIAGALDLPSDQVAEKLLKMEHEGLIERKWTVDEYTYLLKRRSI